MLNEWWAFSCLREGVLITEAVRWKWAWTTDSIE